MLKVRVFRQNGDDRNTLAVWSKDRQRRIPQVLRWMNEMPSTPNRIIETTDATFERDVIERSKEIPVVVDFWADWCGPCKMMAPQFEQAAKQVEPDVRFGKLDTEAARGTAARFNIRSIPTLVLFRNGREVARQPGAMGAKDIVSWIRAHS